MMGDGPVECHDGAISAVAFDPDNNWVITGSYDRQVKISKRADSKKPVAIIDEKSGIDDTDHPLSPTALGDEDVKIWAGAAPRRSPRSSTRRMVSTIQQTGFAYCPATMTLWMHRADRRGRR